MNWISRLERKYGRFCIPNLISLIVGGQILVYAIELFVNQFVSSYLGLSRGLLLMGQVWRLITFVFIPFSGGGPLSVILGIYFTWFIGSARRYLLPVAVPAAGFRHALPRGAGAFVLRLPGEGEVLRPLCCRHVAVQFSYRRVAV